MGWVIILKLIYIPLESAITGCCTEGKYLGIEAAFQRKECSGIEGSDHASGNSLSSADQQGFINESRSDKKDAKAEPKRPNELGVVV